MSRASHDPTHALSIDVEDLACGLLLRACNRVATPSSDVVTATHRMLALVEEYGIKASWFVLGEVAAKFPDLVRKLAAGGHEIGVHGWHHHRVFDLAPEELKESLRRARSLLQDITGQPVRGFRAVEFSITEKTWWAYETLSEVGFAYSSSVFPIRGRRYGVPRAPLVPFRVPCRGRHLTEIPMTAVRVGPWRVPALGGGYLRHFPLAYTRLALWALARERRAGLMYLHPHELGTNVSNESFPINVTDDELCKIRTLSRTYFRNIDRTEGKLRWVFSRHRFAPVCEVFPVHDHQEVWLPVADGTGALT